MRKSGFNWDFLPSYLVLITLVMLPAFILAALNLTVLPVHYVQVVVVGMAILAFLSFIILLKSYLIYYHAKNRHPQNITAQNRPLTNWLRPFGERLQSLGFRRLAEYDVALPMEDDTYTEWCFLSADGVTVAELVDLQENNPAQSNIKPHAVTTAEGEITVPPNFQQLVAQFSTHYKQGQAVVETMFPMGHTVDYPGFRMSAIATSLDAAYRYHLRQVAELETIHGAPDIITDIRDYDALAKVYRQVHIDTKLGLPNRDNAIMISVMVIAFTGVVFATVGSSYNLHIGLLNLTIALIAMLIGVRVARRLQGADINKLKKKELAA
jgi:membrane protein implicated in regulation of membrane protease activity